MRRILLLSVLLCALCAAAPGLAQSQQAAQTQAGWEALEAGNADRAASLFMEALSHRPNDPLAHFGAGVAAHLLGREQDAVTSLTRALQLERRLTDASLLLGDIQYHLGDVDAALRTYEAAAVIAPRNRDLRNRLAAWRKEAGAQKSMETWSKGSFSVVIDGRSDPALAQRALDVLDQSYAAIGTALGAYPPGRIIVTLYTEQQFRDFTNAPDWSDGAFDGRILIPVGGVAKNPARFKQVLTHELAHAFIAGLAPRNIPGWLHEGLASYFEPVNRLPVERMLKLVPMVPLDYLQGSFGSLSESQARLAYSESLVASAIVIERVGPRTSMLIFALGNGQSLQTALDGVGLPYAEFERELARKFKRP